MFVMMERFCQQFSAIQTAAVDLCLRKPIKKEKYIIFGVYKNCLLKHINILKCVYYYFVYIADLAELAMRTCRGVSGADVEALHVHACCV